MQQQLSGDANQTDPLVEVKKMEIDSVAKRDAARLKLDQQEMQQDGVMDQQKIASQEKIAMLRTNQSFTGGANAAQNRKQ